MFKSLSISLRLLSLVATMTFGSMAFAVEPIPEVSVTEPLGSGQTYTLKVADAPSATGYASAANGTIFILADQAYTFNIKATEASNYNIALREVDTSGNENLGNVNGSQDGAGPNSTYLNITRTFTNPGTYTIANAHYFTGPDFSHAAYLAGAVSPLMSTEEVKVAIIKVDLEGHDALRAEEEQPVGETAEEATGVLIQPNSDGGTPDPREAKLRIKAAGVAGLTGEIDYGANFAKLSVGGVVLTNQFYPVAINENADTELREVVPVGEWAFTNTFKATLTVKDASGYPVGSDVLKFVIIKVEIEEFDRVVPYTENEKEVLVTTTPSPLPGGVSVALSVLRTTGNEGAAIVVVPASATITQTTIIKIKGKQQSWGSGSTAAPDNMKLCAKISGSSSPCDIEAFTICSHPVKYRETARSAEANGVLHFEYAWDSDTRDLLDLDRVWVGEHATFSDDGVHVGIGRPWKANHINPTIMPERTLMSGTSGTGSDNHLPTGPTVTAPLPNAGPADTFSSTQYYGYRCLRCNPGAVDNKIGWQQNLMGPITIVRFIEKVGTSWQYRVVKSGLTNTVPLP